MSVFLHDAAVCRKGKSRLITPAGPVIQSGRGLVSGCAQPLLLCPGLFHSLSRFPRPFAALDFPLADGDFQSRIAHSGALVQPLAFAGNVVFLLRGAPGRTVRASALRGQRRGGRLAQSRCRTAGGRSAGPIHRAGAGRRGIRCLRGPRLLARRTGGRRAVCRVA